MAASLDHQLHLGFLLDHDEHVVPELLPHQRQLDELAVLVAVADDGAALRGQRQHRHEFRLGARLQADGDVLGGDDVLHHRFLLVDLDRIQRGIAALVFEALDVRVEGAGELAHAVLQNIREAHQQRQAQARLAQLADQLVEIDGRRVGTLRTHFDIAAIVDGEITRTPVADAVYAAAVGHGPVAAIVLCESVERPCAVISSMFGVGRAPGSPDGPGPARLWWRLAGGCDVAVLTATLGGSLGKAEEIRSCGYPQSPI